MSERQRSGAARPTVALSGSSRSSYRAVCRSRGCRSGVCGGTQRNATKAHQPWRTRGCRLGFEHTHACVRAPVCVRMRVCACMRAGARGGCVFGARRSHLFDLVPALKSTDERRERPSQAQASRLKGAGTATAVAMRRAAPCPRAAGLLRHRNRVDPFGRRNSRRRGRRPCEAYGPPTLTGSVRRARFITSGACHARARAAWLTRWPCRRQAHRRSTAAAQKRRDCRWALCR
jgi:hypothetical protein